MPQFFVIIVHYGDPAPTLAAVQHLTKGSVQPAHIAVIDHASNPLSATFTDQVRIIRPHVNGGYAAGINTGLGALSAMGAQLDDLVIAMNNDVLVQPDTLKAIRDWYRMHTYPALAGVVAQEQDTTVYGGGRVNKWTGRAILNTSPAQAVEYIHGAFLVAPYKVLLQAQGMPEHFFLYWEDVALSYILRRKKIALEVISEARITHATRSRTTSSSDTHPYYLVRNGALFMEQYLAWPWRHYWRLANSVRRTYHHRMRRKSASQAIVYEALRDAQRRVWGARPAAL